MSWNAIFHINCNYIFSQFFYVANQTFSDYNIVLKFKTTILLLENVILANQS